MPHIRFHPELSELDAPRAALEHSAAILAAHRGDMIELLGDHLCGCGPGPQAADHARLQRLEQAHQALRRAYGEDTGRSSPADRR